MASLAEYQQSIRSEVMHDLGQWASKPGRTAPPSLREARRFTAAILSNLGISLRYVDKIASQAIRDWRATQRVKPQTAFGPLTQFYPRGVGETDIIGVRVQFDLRYPNGKPAGAKEYAQVLVNVRGKTTLGQAVAEAQRLYTNHLIKRKYGGRSGGVIAGARIVQVIEGGWSHAQITDQG